MMFIFVTIIIPIIAACISYRLGYIAGQSHEHVEAFMIGAGGWECDPEDGVYRFCYGVRVPLYRLYDDDDDEQT